MVEVIEQVVAQFGTEDSEWFCAVETLFNTLFNIKMKNAPEYGKRMIQQLSKKIETKQREEGVTNMHYA